MESNDRLPYWQTPQRSLSARSHGQKLLPDMAPQETTTEPVPDTKVLLFDILQALQNMSTKIEGQNDRLNSLESSVHPSTFLGARSQWSPYQAPSIHSRILSPEPEPEVEASDQYYECIKEMKSRYEFDDGTSSFMIHPNEPDTEPEQRNYSCQSQSRAPQHLDIQPRDPDVYSLSVYTENMLESAMHRPAAPSIPAASHLNLGIIAASPISNDIDSPNEASSISRQTMHSRTSSETSWKTAKSEFSVRSAHENAEMAFLAYDNWKSGVWSKLRNEERREKKREMQRLSAVRPVIEKKSLWERFENVMKRLRELNSELVVGQRIGRDKRVTIVC